ncbi:MAG: GNAT family N-acetyltransferase [Candidatus Mycalebacterium zealandia]|nr:MAG: GNAT family N-acetyltransferase [Candidatus Mycalebacterium zealandia]
MKISKAEGLTVSFRFVREDDAEFILNLRLDPELGLYLSPTDPSVEKQREWLAEYKRREEAGEEYFYIITNNKNGKRCGTARLIIKEEHFEFGSFILNSDKTPTASIETALFIYHTGFDNLNFEKAHFNANKENIRVVKFHEKMGVRIIGEVETGVGIEHLYEMDLRDWAKLREKFKAFIVKDLN